MGRLDDPVFIPLEGMSGSARLEKVFAWFAELCERYEVDESKRPPKTLVELGKAYKRLCLTEATEEATSLIWRGIAAASNEEALFQPMPTGTYKLIYKHPSEPRFGAIKAEKAWAEIVSDHDSLYDGYSYSSLLYFSCMITNIMQGSWEYTLGNLRPVVQNQRSWQAANGCLVKTGKVLSHILQPMSADKLSVLAGFVQDQLREAVASTNKVHVSEDVGSIYRMGGYFASCMRSLGWDDKSTGKNSYQIYHDLGAKIAYMVEPEFYNGSPVVRDGKPVLKLVARAILWDRVFWREREDKEPVVIRIMDTIYRETVEQEAAMRKFARQNGYAYKKVSQSYGCKEFTYGPDRSNEDFTLSDAWVVLQDGKAWIRGMYERCPWVDIFCNIDRDDTVAQTVPIHGGLCLHSQSGHAGWLTEKIKCKHCQRCLEIDEDEEEWHQSSNGDWSCPRCFDLNWGTCCKCDEDAPIDDFTEVEGDLYCNDCIDNHWRQCDGCGLWFPVHHGDCEELYYDPDGENQYCEECYSERFSYCERCHENYPVENTRWLNDLQITVCEHCLDQYYRYCDDCDAWFLIEDTVEVTITDDHSTDYSRSINVCTNCLNDGDYVRCPECKDWYDELDPRSNHTICYSCFRHQYSWCQRFECYCRKDCHECDTCKEALHDMSE